MTTAVSPARKKKPRRAASISTVTAAECTQPRVANNPHAQTIQCPDCAKNFVLAAVVKDKPFWDPVAAQHKFRRAFYCDHCDHIVSWFQLCASNGAIGPRADDDPPAIIRGKEQIERFLKAHPEARGVTHEERP